MKDYNEFIHTADWHIDYLKKHKRKAKESLDQLVQYCKQNKVRGIWHSGDIWDRLQDYGNDSGAKLAHSYLIELSYLVDFIIIIKGNNAHDAPDSVALLHQLRPNIFAYEKNVALGIRYGYRHDALYVVDLLREKPVCTDFNLLVHVIPYPTKTNFIDLTSIDNNNSNFEEQFEMVMDLHGVISSQYKNIPIATLFHGNVAGCTLSNGQTLIGQDIIIPPAYLRRTGAHYYALGHIHLPQEIEENMWYSGSLYNKDFGETEQKFFNSIKFYNGKLNPVVEQVLFRASRPMIVVKAKFENGDFVYENHLPENGEFKFSYEINENDKKLITPDMIAGLKKKFGEDVIIAPKTIPMQREGRSAEILNITSLVDKVVEFGRITNFPVTESIKEKVKAIEEEARIIK